jgi:hypothetical protein
MFMCIIDEKFFKKHGLKRVFFTSAKGWKRMKKDDLNCLGKVFLLFKTSNWCFGQQHNSKGYII